MQLSTRHFGEIEVDEAKKIKFDEGLPGFPDDKEFILLEDSNESEKEESGPFYWLQSVSDGNNAFIVMDVYSMIPDYNPILNQDDISSLGDGEEGNLLIYNIVVLPEDAKKMSVNLVAPVIINQNTKKGKQAIAGNDEYGIRHYLFENA